MRMDTINSPIPSDWYCTSWCIIFSPSDSHALKERTTKKKKRKIGSLLAFLLQD